MIVVRDFDRLKGKELVATIGFFDGVHLGHRFLIDEMKEIAKARNLPSAIITFPEHPRAVLHADYQPKLLNSFEEKLQQLETTGVDYCIVLDFTIELSRLSAKEFITSILAKSLHVKTLLIGYDHRFGHDRTDGFEQYVVYGTECGIEVLKASPYDEGNTAVSSSEIRKLLQAGNVAEAAYLLTYPYQLLGHIVSGYKVGRTLGFPTANIRVDEPFKVIPGIGVYAVWVEVEGERYKGMLYIGDRPTLNNGKDISMEVNILDFSGDIYNDSIRVSFVQYVRGDIKFDSLEDAIRKLMEEEQEKRAAEELGKEKETSVEEASMEKVSMEKGFQTEGDLLTADSTSCTYPADEPDKEDIRYITWYTEEGIFCRKAGQTEGYEWSISFENREQYEKVMSLIGQLPSDWNLRFEAHENFWRDFLDDKIDVDDFMDFMRSINQGEKIFCRYPGGTLYTADEIDSLMFEQYLKENHMTLEDYHASQEAFRAKHGYPGYY